jgi:hypothetical protein
MALDRSPHLVAAPVVFKKASDSYFRDVSPKLLAA